MRRSVQLLLLCLAAAGPLAAQGRARVGVSLQMNPSGPPDLLVHVTGLFDDPRWREALNDAYLVRLHWKVVLWESHGLFDRQRTPTEWDDILQQVPVIDVFTFEERTARTSHTYTFHTLDSLTTWVESGAKLLTPNNLQQGKWYYTVDVSISAEPPPDARGSGDDPASGSLQWVQRIVLGRGDHDDLPEAKSAPFVVGRP